jgi:hypothetical protein
MAENEALTEAFEYGDRGLKVLKTTLSFLKNSQEADQGLTHILQEVYDDYDHFLKFMEIYFEDQPGTEQEDTAK